MFHLKGRSTRIAGGVAVTLVSDGGLRLSFHHFPVFYMWKKAQTRLTNTALELSSESCVLNVRHDLYMKITSQGHLLLRNGLSMSEGDHPYQFLKLGLLTLT